MPTLDRDRTAAPGDYPPVWLATIAWAGEVFHAAWGTGDGLPVDDVSDVLVDRDGFVWVATWDGLVRFDGVRFEAVEPADWPSHRVVQLQQARDGTIWAQTEPGALVRVDPGGLAVFPLGYGGRAHPLVEDADGRWVMVQRDGLRRWDGQGFAPLAPEVFAADPPTDLTAAPDGQLWALTGAGRLYRIDGDRAVEWPFAGGPPPGVGRQLRVAPDGWWIGAPDAVYRLTGHVAVRLTDRGARWEPRVRGLEAEADGSLWVGTLDGLLRWRDGAVEVVASGPDLRTPGRAFVARDPAGNTWVSSGRAVLRDGEVVFHLPPGDASIVDLTLDRYGSAWVATDGAGLHQLIPPRIEPVGALPGGLLPNVYAVGADPDGALWLGTTVRGVDRVAGGAVVHLDQGFDTEARSIALSRDGTRWVGQRRHGLGTLVGDRWVRDPAIPVEGVPALLERSDGTLVAGADDGLWTRATGDWTRVAGVPRGVRALAEDPDGALWIGTSADGLWRVDPTGAGRVEVGADAIRSLLPDGRGGVWAGTEDAGLRHSGAGAPIGLAEGLPSRTVHALVDDGRGSVWGSTNRGLFRIPVAALGARAAGGADPLPIGVYTERDGLRDAEGNGGNGQAGLRLPDGRLVFATQAGAAVVDPARVDAAAVPPPLAILGLQVDGRRRASETPLARGERTFGVDVAVLGLRDPHRAMAEWRLDGVDPDWVRGGTRRTAWYTDLGPGTYVFHLRGADADGTLAVREPTATITIPPWPWETWPLRLAAGAAAIGLVASGVRARLAAGRRRQRELEAVVEAQAARLAELDRRKIRHFADLSHELRTPLTLLLGPLQDLREGRHGPLPAEADAPLTLAERNARALFEVVNQLLDLVKADAGQLALRPEVHDLGALVRQVTANFAPLAERQGVRLVEEGPTAPIPVRVDPRELPKVVGNLLSNALKFTPRGGEVRVVVGADGSFAVHDTGIGISEPDRIFERFVVGATSGLQPGTGLGLALTRELVALHHGRLEVQSALGEGSVFTVTLPLATGSVAPLPAAPPAPMLPPLVPREPAEPDDRTTVLVVDDHADLRRWIADLLSPTYRVVEAADGLEALAAMRRDPPDVVVSDVMMPGMDGHDLVRALRADPDHALVPIVLVSARGGADSQVEGLERGADVYLVKPFSSAVLRAQVDGLVAQRARLRERFAEPAPVEAEPVSADERYLRAVRAVIHERHGDPAFGVQELADAVHQDRAHLFRRVKALTGTAPSDLIRQARLEHAARLLTHRSGTVSEIAYATGFGSLSSFSTSFREHFGVSPSKFAGKSP